jgi:hypothetical protein
MSEENDRDLKCWDISTQGVKCERDAHTAFQETWPSLSILGVSYRPCMSFYLCYTQRATSTPVLEDVALPPTHPGQL